MEDHDVLPCSTVSLAADEPLAGTASRFRFWLLIEQPGRWGHHALVDSDFPPDVGASLRDRGEELGVRVLLIKRRERPWPARRRCFVAYTGARQQRLAAFEVDRAEELLHLDLRELVAARFAGFGEDVEGPVFLVCTHGKHDQCCARLGLPLYQSLADTRDGQAWEATHVGGDRFAGNLVCFPHGLYFGRVDPGDAPSVAGGYARGRIDLRFYRGRSAYPPPVQAAERFVRQEAGLLGVDDLVVRGHRRVAPGRRRVELADRAGRLHVVDVEASLLSPRPLTCKATHAEQPRALVVHRVE